MWIIWSIIAFINTEASFTLHDNACLHLYFLSWCHGKPQFYKTRKVTAKTCITLSINIYIELWSTTCPWWHGQTMWQWHRLSYLLTTDHEVCHYYCTWTWTCLVTRCQRFPAVLLQGQHQDIITANNDMYKTIIQVYTFLATIIIIYLFIFNHSVLCQPGNSLHVRRHSSIELWTMRLISVSK